MLYFERLSLWLYFTILVSTAVQMYREFARIAMFCYQSIAAHSFKRLVSLDVFTRTYVCVCAVLPEQMELKSQKQGIFQRRTRSAIAQWL